MAYERLRNSITKGNLWLYILSVLEDGAATPSEIRESVRREFGVSAAAITFYSVLYRLSREGMVKKSSAAFRSAYEATARGKEELEKARKLIRETGERLGRTPRGS